MNNLDKFGELLMKEVRDLTTEHYLMIKSGKMKSAIAQSIYANIQRLNEEDKSILDSVAGELIDRTISNFLRMLENSEEFTIAIEEDVPADSNIVELSDGLAGELFTEDGWYANYSQNLLNRKTM